MEGTVSESNSKKNEKGKQAKQLSTMKKIDLSSARLLAQLKEKANKKDFGRKVQDREILSLAIKLVTDDHLKELQNLTYSERDRLAMAHEEYQRANGKITLDQFIGKLLKGEVLNKK